LEAYGLEAAPVGMGNAERTEDEGRWTRDEKRTREIRTVRDLNVYRKVFLSSLFLAKRSSFVPRFS